MKKFNLKGFIISLAVFVLALTLAIVLMLCMNDTKKPPEEESSQQESETVQTPPEVETVSTDSYTYLTDISEYESILNTVDEKYRLLVNKENPLGADDAPESLTALDESITLFEKYIELDNGAALATTALIAEMRAAGFSDIYVTSAYRTYAYQKQLFDGYCDEERKNHPSWSEEQIKEQVLTYSAAPGTSEHQSGLCVDFFVSPGMQELENYGSEGACNDVGFAETAEFRWLKENAHKFGFILRYPDGKDNETGYAYESWHYRFVGVDLASKIKDSGLTLEKYLEQSNLSNS